MVKNLFILCFLLSAMGSSAQDSAFMKLLSSLHNTYATENVYLHLDKSICLSGDTIWFKGYVLEGNFLSDNSTSLHVELFDKRGSLMLTKVFPLYSGITVGQLKIPANASPDVYYIRAYTKWQCNFDTRRLFQVPVTVMDSKSNNVAVLEKLHRNKNFSLSSGDSITMTCSDTPKGLYCTVMSSEAGPYVDSTLQLYFIAPGVTGKTNFTLNKKRLSKGILLPPSPQFREHEMDLVLLSAAGRVILQDKVFFPANNITADIFPDTLNTTEKGFNSWRINIKDTTIATLSVSIIDAEVDTNRISIGNSISSTVLNYQDLVKGKLPDVNLVDSNYIRCRGIAQKVSNRKRIKNKSLLAFITTKDSATSFEIIPIDSSGKFDLRNLFFYDTASVQFQLQDKNFRAKDIALEFDWFSSPVFTADSITYSYTKRTALQTTPLMDVTKRKDMFSFEKMGAMKEVIITAKKKTVVEKMDEEYASGAFRGGINSKSFDLINDNMALGVSLGTFLQSKMAGIMVERDSAGNEIITYRRDRLLIFLNEMEVSYDMLSSISLFQIAYVKVFPPPFVMGRLMQGAICLYTKKGSELEVPENSKSNTGLNKTQLPGYDRVVIPSAISRAGVYKTNDADNRINLYWNPLLTAGEHVIRFYNNDYTKKFRIIIEGIGTRGELLHFEKVIQQ